MTINLTRYSVGLIRAIDRLWAAESKAVMAGRITEYDKIRNKRLALSTGLATILSSHVR